MKINVNHIICIILFLNLITVKGQECFDFGEITPPISTYNDHLIYPEGTIIHDYGNLQLIKTHDLWSGPPDYTEPTTFNFISGGILLYNGPITLLTSDYGEVCKRLNFSIDSRFIIVDGDTTDLTTAPFPKYVKDSLRIYSLGASAFSIIGKFDSVIISNGLTQTQLSNVCLSECDGTENCNTDFEFSISEDTIVDFTNLSTLGPEADFFDWYLEDEITDFENPSYTYPGEGTYSACLRIIENSCVMGSNDTICKEITISFGEETEFVNDIENHNTLTPNDDGIGDFIGIQSGSKIFNRHGKLLIEYAYDLEWTGIDSKGNLLPTGLYTILNNSETYQVTIIR